MNVRSTARDAGTKLQGLLELTRPGDAIAAGVLTFIGAFVTGGAFEEPTAVAAAVLATLCGVGGGMAINDYFDREIDAINNPERPIPSGTISPRGAELFAAWLFVGAVAFSLTLPPLAIGIAVVNLAALVAYTNVFKGLPGAGNALVAYLVGSTFLFGAAAVGSPGTPVLVLFLLAALSNLSRELIKDVEDVEGDRAEGLNTLPIAVGERPALHLSTALLAVSMLASPLPYLLGALGAPYLVLVIPALVLMAYAAYRSYDDPAAGQSVLKYGMFLATVSFVVGRVALLV